MKKLLIAIAAAGMLVCLPSPPACAQDGMPPTTAADPATKSTVMSSFGKLPLSFEPNNGQLQDYVIFACRLPHKFFIFRKEGLDIHLNQHGPDKQDRKIEVRFKDANEDPVVEGVSKLPGTVNYFIGNDPDKWKSSIPTHSKIKYKDLYPGVEIDYYGRDGMLEYDFIVKPGADASQILLWYQDAVLYDIDDKGNLIVDMGWGQLMETAPNAYQEINGERRPVQASYQVLEDPDDNANANARSITFEVGIYDPNYDLVID